MTAACCSFCGQPLIDRGAVERLEHNRAQFESDLRLSLAAKARADADEVLKLERQRLRAQVDKDRLETEKRMRRELGRTQAARERQLGRTVDRLQEQNDELRRRLDRLSASDRGDDQEADIFERLRRAFPGDEIKRHGRCGDILQTVRTPDDGKSDRAGLIVYEVKDRLRWSNTFIQQLKADGARHHTEYLVLVTRALPRGARGMCVRDRVVIVTPAHAIHLGDVMRRLVLEVHRASRTSLGAHEKAGRLYKYISSTEFRQAFGEVIAAAGKLDEMLQKERHAHERSWTRRQLAYNQLQGSASAIDETIRGLIESGTTVGNASTDSLL